MDAKRDVVAKEIVAKLRHFARMYGIDSLFIAGGFCRSMYLNRLGDIEDIDVASAYPQQCQEMAGLFASEVMNTVPVIYKESGTAAVMFKSDMGEMRIEFQGKSPNQYMFNQEIREWMHNHKIEDIPVMNNIFGRDFTINSLIYALNNGQLYDLTHQGEKDLDRGIIRSLLPPEMLIKYNPIAALRAIRFSVRYDFKIDEALQEQLRKSYEHLTRAISQERLVSEIVKTLKINGPEVLKEMKRFDLDKLLVDTRIHEYLMLEAK